jgi:hypothetical protein
MNYKKFELILSVANFNPTELLERMKTRFDSIFLTCSLPMKLTTNIFPITVYIDEVSDADCTGEVNEHVLECLKENVFCTDHIFKIAQKLRKMNNIETCTTFIAVFICKQANLKDSYGDCQYDEENNNWIVTLTNQRLDAICSTLLHELYEILLYNEKEEVHCNESECFMDPDSVSLFLCSKCKEKLDGVNG